MKIPYVIEIDLAKVQYLAGAKTAFHDVDTVIVLQRDPGSPTGVVATALSSSEPTNVLVTGDQTAVSSLSGVETGPKPS